MDEERLKRIRANIAKHEERKKTQNIMGDIDSSKLDRSNTSYNKNDAAFEMAKQHYQNSYVPKKAQEYYKGVENYRNAYSQVNKPSADNYTVMTPENLVANNLADGMYIDSETRNNVKERSNAVYNNENKKYTEQYARLNEKAKAAYRNTQQRREYDSKLNNQIDKYYSQFGNAEDYNKSRKQQILLNYDEDTAVKNATASTDKIKEIYSDENDNGRYHIVLTNGADIPIFATQDEENEYLGSKATIHSSPEQTKMNLAKQILPQDFFEKMRYVQQANEAKREKDRYENDPLYRIDVDNAIQKYNEQQAQAQKLSDYMQNQNAFGQIASSTAESFQKWGDDLWASVYGVIDALDFGAFGDNPQKAVEYFNNQATVKSLALKNYNKNKYGEFGGNVVKVFQDALPDAIISLGMAYASGGASLATEAGTKITADMAKKEIAKAVATKAKTAVLSALKNPNFYWTFIREGGSAYNDAIASGADDTQALIALLGTGFTNSMIELGGGIEKIPENKGAIKDWLKGIGSSFKEEGLEEVTQGIAGQLIAKAVYAPTMAWYSMADDGSGVFNPKRSWEEFIGGAVGGAMGGFVGGGINVATNKIVSNIYAADYMRYGIQTGDLDHIAKAYPDTDFAKEYTKLREQVVKDGNTKSLKKVSNSKLAKLANMAQPLISKYADTQAEALIAPFTQNASEEQKKEISTVVRKLLQGEEITADEAKTATNTNGTLPALSYITGRDFTKMKADELVQASKDGIFETVSAIDEGSETAENLARTQRIYNATQNFLTEKQYDNDLSGAPTITAQIGDESVKITGIDHVENGEVYVNLSNGTTQEAQSLNTDEVTTALLSYASEYDTKTASAFIGGYTGNISVGEYARSFAGVNSAAKAGLSYDNIVKSAPTMINNVGIDTAKTLTKSGNAFALKQATADIENTVSAQQRQATRNDKTSVKNKTGGTVTREHRILARTVSKVTGYTVVLVDSTNVKNGKTVNGRKAIGEFNSTKGEIVLDIGSDDVVATTLHEVTHYIKLNAPTQYNALRDAVIEYATKTGKIEYYLEKYANSYGTDNVYELTEEMTADAAEALLTNEKFISELLSDNSFVNAVVGENKGFVRKFLDTLHDIISSIKDYLKGRNVNHQIARELSEDVKALEKIEKLWRDALTAAVNNHAESSAVKQDTKKSATESGTKFSITEDMSEQERYEELKDKSIVVSKPDMSKVSNIDIEAYKNLSTKEAKKLIRRIAEMLGIHNVNYKNSNIKFDFAFSKGSLDTSLNHQSEYGGSYTDYAEMLTCLDKLVENAELIEIHKNYKGNEYLKNTFVLISAINNDGNITPVQLEVKEYDKGQSNSLYLNVILSKIKESAVVKGEHNGNADISNPLVADSAISLSQLFANVNPADKRFLKYVPDNFLSTEQIEAKRKAQKSDYKNHNRYVEVFENDKNGSDNKFSLSEPVEEKGNLIAVHNIYTDKLVKSLKLGGFPMPSIAVIKSDMGHGNYGECSFVFDKSTIDPKADKRNKVYGGDAWTPTYPSIDYKVNENVADKARKKYYDLYEQYGEKVRGMYRYGVTLEDTLNSEGGEQKMLNKLYDDPAMMQVYRLDHGENAISNIVKREEKQTLNEQEIALSKQLISTLGNRIEKIAVESPLSLRKAFFNKYHDEVIEAFKKYYESTGMSAEEAESKIASTKVFTFTSSLANALKYKNNKGVEVTETVDNKATNKAIRDSVDQSEYRKWIDNLLKGAEEKRGIWNGKDFYTPSGEMRNFDALHYEETLENVVKAMRSEMNGDTLFAGMGIWGVAQKEYSSIDKLKSDSARLQKMSDDEYSNIKSGFAEQLSEVTKAIKNDYSGNDFIDSDIVAGNIVDAVRESKTKSGIKSYLKEHYPDITDTAVDDIVNLVHGIMEMPTGYFEAKPQRAIRFDEVKYAVLPETLDENIKKQLADYGIQIVEYEDGNEEDRTAKLNSLDDVKFSISEQASAEYEMLKQENNDLKTQIEALKKEMELTSGHTVDAEVVSKLAKRYIREYKSKANVEEVSAKLKQIFEYIANEDANAEEANKAMFELASQIVNKSETLNTEMRDTFKDELDIIRSARIYVDDATKAEIESLYGDYNTFRKSMFGRMKLTTNKESHGQTVDMLVQELAELAPGQFDTNVSEGECLEQLVSFIEATKPRIENPFGDSVAEAASELAWQIFDDYFDIPEVKTFADKYEAKLQKVINENRIARAELRKAERAKAKAFYDEKLKALRDEKNEAIAKLRKEKNDKYDNDIKNLRDAKDKKLNDVRADRDAKLKALRERYREQQREKRENAAKSELRARITAEYKKLYKDLTSNSKEHHIPEVYKETVANVLANIDLISKASKEKAAKTGEVTKVAEKLNNQLTALENFILNYSMYGNKDDGSSNEQLYNFDPDLISNIKKMKEYFGRYANSGVKAVSDMNTEELEALHNMLKALRYAVRTADKALSANITQRISTLAESSIAEMATDKTRNPFNKNKAAQVVGAVDTYINSQMLDARSYYNGMGNSAFEIYKAFRSGLNSFIKHTHEAQNYFAKVRKDSGYTDKQIKHLVDDYKTYTVSHGEIAMSRAQIMSLYCLSKREQALEHIYKGGIRPTDLKGKRQIKPVMISPDELSSLLKNLNSTEIAMADRLQQFMATTCAEWGNEVSMAMYGYAKFTERNYFPIKSSDTKIRTNDQNSGGDTGLYSVLNYGMTKSLVKNANNSIDVGDIFSVTRQHIEEMSSYSAYAGAVADGMRWFNYNNRETGESVKQSMLNKFGTNGSKYFIELVRDINRNKPTGNYGGEISSVLTSAQKAAAIAGNLSVVVQQPTAIARACTELSLDLITEGIAISATHIKKSVQEAQAHSEIAWWKSQGFFETNMSKSMDEIITGRSTAKDKIVEMAMKPAGLADDVTWGAIWEATKLWTKKYHPEVKVNSEEFYSITKEKFDDVVDQTQVVDSVLHRPMILRSKNALVKMDMSFMAEPLKSANLLRNAIVDVKNKKPNATKRLIRVYASCIMANVLAAAAKAIVMAFRDTGDDEWWEKWFSSFSSDLLSTLNPLSIIPFVKDIFSVLDGYDVERMDMSAVTGIIQFVQQAVEYAQKDNLDKALNLQSAYKLTRYLSQLTGLPVYNVLREIDTIIDIFGEPIFRASHATPNTERYEALYNAVMKNDEAEMQNEYDRLGKTQKEIEQRLKSKIIDDSKGNKMFNEDVDKAAKARISGDVKTAVEIVRNLADTMALSKDFWTACVNARANKISKAQENRTRLIEAGISKLMVDNMSDTEVNEALKSYEAEADTSTASDLNEDTNTESLYTADDLVKALQNGNESDYNTAYDDMVSAKAVSLIMQAEADNKELTADEAEEKAESSIKSAITKVLKPLMRELYKTDKKKFNEMRKKIIKKFGYTSKQITKWLTSEE